MSVSEGFRTFVLEQLARSTAAIRARAMFGGVGLYSGDLFFALMDGDVLYFKVDDTTRVRFEERGMGPFRPGGEGGEMMQYYEVPADVLEDVDALAPWAADAVEVAPLAGVTLHPPSPTPAVSAVKSACSAIDLRWFAARHTSHESTAHSFSSRSSGSACCPGARRPSSASASEVC